MQNWPQYVPPYGWGDKTSATVTVPQSSLGFSVPDWNTGDYYPALDGQWINLLNGVLLATVRNNGRDNGDGFGVRYGTVETNSLNTPWGGNAFLATSVAGPDNNTGDELNIDLAAAYFPYSQGWTGASVAADGSILASGGGIAPGNVSHPSTGVYHLTLSGVDTRAGGLVLANGGQNSNNFAAAGASPDGTQFVVQVRDNVAGGLENGIVNLLYLPMDTPGLVMGRVSGLGGVYNRSGQFTLRRTDTGTFRLSIPGQNSTTGILLLTPDATSTASDNILSYQADGSDFVIEQRELDGGTPYLNNVGGAPAFSFAFIPFSNPPTAPGGRTFNPAGQVAAANMVVIERKMTGANPALDAEFGASDHGDRVIRVRVRFTGQPCSTLAVQDLAVINNARTALEQSFVLPGNANTMDSLKGLKSRAEKTSGCPAV